MGFVWIMTKPKHSQLNPLHSRLEDLVGPSFFSLFDTFSKRPHDSGNGVTALPTTLVLFQPSHLIYCRIRIFGPTQDECNRLLITSVKAKPRVSPNLKDDVRLFGIGDHRETPSWFLRETLMMECAPGSSPHWHPYPEMLKFGSRSYRGISTAQHPAMKRGSGSPHLSSEGRNIFPAGDFVVATEIHMNEEPVYVYSSADYIVKTNKRS
jgi:hypothetical protein